MHKQLNLIIMKTNFNRIFLIASMCLMSISLQAQRSGQPWWDLMDDPTANFDTIIHYANDWYAKNPDSVNPKMIGQKTFTHWAHFWDSRLDSNRTRIEYIRNFSESMFNMDSICTTEQTLPTWERYGPNITPSAAYNSGIGVINDLWIDPSSPSRMYAVADRAGAFVTTDSGANWQSLTDFNRMVGLGARDILVHPTNPNIIYIASFINSISPGVIKTTDGGHTWNHTCWSFDIQNGEYNADIRRIAMHPTQPSTIYMASKHALRKSTNGAASYSTVLIDNDTESFFTDLDISKADPDLVYTSGRKIYRYHPNTLLTNLTSNVINAIPDISGSTKTINNILVALDDTDDQELNLCVLVGYSNTNSRTYFLRSSNQGSSFYSMGFLEEFSTNYSTHLVKDHSFEKSKIDPNKFYAGSIQAYMIVDSLGTWSINNNYSDWSSANSVNFMHADIRRIVVRKIDNNTEEVYWCHDGGISRRKNTENSFTNITGVGLNIGNTSGFDVNDFYGQTHLGLVHCGTQRVVENETIWDVYGAGDGGDVAIHPSAPNQVVYNTNGRLCLNTQFGQGGSNCLTPPASQAVPNNNFAYLFMPYEPKYGFPGAYYTGYKALFTFNASNSSRIQVGQQHIEMIQEIASCEADGNVVWYAPNKPLSNSNSLMKSTDGGANWTDVSQNFSNPPGFGVGAIELDPTNPDRVWVGIASLIGSWYDGTKKIYYTSDGGDSLLDISNGLPSPDFPIRDLEYDPLNNVLYCANDAGVWYRDLNESTNNQVWKCFNNNLPGLYIEHLKINECTRTILAGAWGRGLYEADLIETDYVNNANNFAEITSDSTMAGDHQSVRHIRVKFNSKLTITGTLRMAKGTRIEIEPGSELIVDGGTITNTCGELWEGIRTWGAQNTTSTYGGYKDFPQFVNGKHGVVRTKNNALIENAKTAITLGYGPDEQNGGILYANRTTFKNNWRSVQFLDYQNRLTISPYGEVNNLSKITDCNFFTTETLHDPVFTEPYAQISMWQVKGVQIRASNFADSVAWTDPYRSFISGRRIGVLSMDASYNLDPTCTGNYGQLGQSLNPCLTNPNANRNSFYGYFDGILAEGINPIYPVTIRGVDFTDNFTGVRLVGTDLAEVYQNEFNVLNKQNTSGLYLDGSTGYYVEANEFFGPSNTSANGPVGIVVRNSGIDENYVTNNYMQDLRTAAAFFDDNDGPGLNDGFQYLCNEMANNHFDMRLTGGSGQNNTIDIALHQGFCNQSNPNGSRPAMNELQTNCTQDRQFQVTKPSQQTVYYHYFNNLPDYEPTCFTNSLITKDNCGDAEDDAGSYCLVNEKAEGSPHDLILDIQLDTAKIGLLNDSISIFSDSIHARIDDNNTNGNSAIMALCAQSAAYISNAEVLYLIEKKPSALDETDLLTCLEHLAPLSDDAAAALETNYNAVYNQLLTYIENNSLVTSPYTNTLLEVNHYERHIKKLREEVLRYWLVYDTTGVGMDSALAFLRTSAQPIDKMREGRLLARMGDTDQANSIFSSMSDSGDYYQNAALWNVLMQSLWADTAGISAHLLDSNLMEQASDLAASEIQDLAAYNAKALLALVADSAIISPMYPEETSSNKKEASDSFFDDFEEVGEDLMTIYPNPANNQITLNFTLPDNTSEATLHLYGIDGRFIEQYTISSKQKTMELNVANFANGTYIYLLSADGKLIARKKLNVAK
jgi:hypothetical protein